MNSVKKLVLNKNLILIGNFIRSNDNRKFLFSSLSALKRREPIICLNKLTLSTMTTESTTICVNDSDKRVVENGEKKSEKHLIYKGPFLAFADIIVHLVNEYKSERCVVFVGSKTKGIIINDQLNKLGIYSQNLHSDHAQGKRERTFTSFERGVFKILVLTDDTLGRYTEIQAKIDLIVHASVPKDGLKSYLNRSNRIVPYADVDDDTGGKVKRVRTVMLHSNEVKELKRLDEIRNSIQFNQLRLPNDLKNKIKEISLNRDDEKEPNQRSESFSQDTEMNRNTRFDRYSETSRKYNGRDGGSRNRH